MAYTRRMFLGLACLLCLGLGVAVWWLERHPYAADPLVYRRAPDYVFNRDDPTAPPFQPRDWAGRKFFISFFASWCGPCHAEHPVLMALARDTRIPMIGVAHHDRPIDTKRMLDGLGNPYQLVLNDFSGDGAVAWGLRGVPESFIVDAAGQIVWHHVGPLTQELSAAQIRPLLTQMEPGAQ